MLDLQHAPCSQSYSFTSDYTGPEFLWFTAACQDRTVALWKAIEIYAGRDRIIHATATGDGVRYDVLGEGDRGQWFADHLVGARRVLAADAAPAQPDAAPDEEGLDRPDRAPKPSGSPR